ncbi:MAG: hypothetical protein QOE89_1866, partial [Pseudonocardiales bacterium]|nr:hypothetical protein [Pseudonocardiales bacterium]
MGSPCNEFGNDPEAGNNKSTSCANTGQCWANVGSPAATKISGDAHRTTTAAAIPTIAPAGFNSDYDARGYFYTVNVASDTANLQLDAFDPALIAVGDLCDQNGLPGLPATGTPADPPYAKGSASSFCTGDVRYGGAGDVTSQFTVRQQVATSNPWDPHVLPSRARLHHELRGLQRRPEQDRELLRVPTQRVSQMGPAVHDRHG